MAESVNTSEEQWTGAEKVSWNLQDLYLSPVEVRTDLAQARERAEAFRARYRGRIGRLGETELAEALVQFEDLHDRLNRAATFAYLDWCTQTEDPEKGALFQYVREEYSRISQELLFFELELIFASAAKQEAWKQSPSLHRYRHYLEMLAHRREHVLSEPEERILAEKAITGAGAWVRFFDELLGGLRFSLDGRELTEQEVLARLYEAEREVRRTAALAFTEGLKAYVRTLAYIFNTLLAEKASDDRLRQYPHWLAARNLANEISDEAVAGLVTAVRERYDLVARYYHLKRRLLGLDELYDYDRYAPVGLEGGRYTWSEAKAIVLRAYEQFHPEIGRIAARFFEERWIDAAVRPGKRAGAFSHSAVPQVHPYILVNFTGNVRDVQTLAHELGHGVHQYLARKQGSLQADTPLTTAETASVFGEMLVFQNLLEAEQDSRRKLAMLMAKIDDTIATVFRQIAMHCFEEHIHRQRREEGELTVQRFGEYWIQTQEEMFGDSLRLGDHYRLWWSYIPHFIHSPGYVYAYAFGELLVLALYNRYRRRPEGFAEQYRRLLEAGGSDWPHELLRPFEVDLLDPDFWKEGLREIENLIDQAERLAAS